MRLFRVTFNEAVSGLNGVGLLRTIDDPYIPEFSLLNSHNNRCKMDVQWNFGADRKRDPIDPHPWRSLGIGDNVAAEGSIHCEQVLAPTPKNFENIFFLRMNYGPS